MGVSVIDVCVSASIVVGMCYLIWSDSAVENDDYTVREEVFEGVEGLTDVHQTRVCSLTASTGSNIAVDMAYSQERPLTPYTPTDAEEIGNRILRKLFQECTCSFDLSKSLCFQWTLIINELNYSKTNVGFCGGTTATSCNPSTTSPSRLENATIAKIFIKQQDLGLFKGNLSCLDSSVLCALKSADRGIFSDSYVQTVISTYDIYNNM